uniref:Putative secreted protein n=1 Tax=Ixodes scapularis TaxID=6945 RepID=A0A4D5RXQ2_IXOSC
MASSFIGLLVLCLCLVYDQVGCQDQVRRTADIVIVLKSEDGGLPRVGLRSRCTHHIECAQLYAVCSNLTHSCVCPRGYRSNGISCDYVAGPAGDPPDSVAIYKVTLVVAAVFMVVVFTFFVGCVIKRTCERAREYNERMRELSTDVYTVPVEFEGMEKPPSYTDIVKIDHMLYGVPPPDYSTVTSTGPTASQAVLPPRTQPLSAFLQSSPPGPSSGQIRLLPLGTTPALAAGSGNTEHLSADIGGRSDVQS